MSVSFGLLSSSAVLLLGLVLTFVVREAWPALGSSTLWQLQWLPSEGRYGLSPMAIASVAVTLVALALAVPFGIGTAVYVRFYASRPTAAFVSAALALLSGVPSVVFGLWGLTVLVPLVAAWHPPGTSVLVASVVLALMVTPTVALTSASALEAVPSPWLSGGAALGLSTRAIITGVALPAAKSGIRSGIVLATARALGETMAVLMVAGNVVQVPSSIFEPVRVVTANIALEMAYAVDKHRAALFASGLLLALVVLALTWAASTKPKGARRAG